MTDQERQKAEEMISRLELSVGQVFPRDGGNAALLASMIQTLNGLRSLLGLVPSTPQVGEGQLSEPHDKVGGEHLVDATASSGHRPGHAPTPFRRSATLRSALASSVFIGGRSASVARVAARSTSSVLSRTINNARKIMLAFFPRCSKFTITIFIIYSHQTRK